MAGLYEKTNPPPEEIFLRDASTLSFNNESIDEISEIIAETLGLSLSKSQNTITLKGDGCTEAVAQ